MNVWQPYFIAIAIGLLIGIEREKAHPKEKSMGIRTFLLISLLGAIAGDLQNFWLAAVVAIFAFGLILISYFSQNNSKNTDADQGLTTEFAAGIVFCLGYAAHESPTLSSLIGPLVAVILFSKASLHRFTHAIKPSEFQAALLLLLSGVVIVNLVPDAVIDPWGVFNPKKFGYLVLTLATLEFASYLATKIVGKEKGPLLFGFLGGFVSSTAVILASARQSVKSPTQWRSTLSTTLAAQLSALIELLFIVGFVAPSVLLPLVMPIGISGLMIVFVIFVLIHKSESIHSDLKLQSPLDWQGVLRLALMLACFLAAISLVKRWLGDQATLLMSFVAGLFELHGVSMANATMFSQGHLTIQVTTQNILLAVIASMVAKIGISLIVARNGRFTQVLILSTLPIMIFLAATLWLG